MELCKTGALEQEGHTSGGLHAAQSLLAGLIKPSQWFNQREETSEILFAARSVLAVTLLKCALKIPSPNCEVEERYN